MERARQHAQDRQIESSSSEDIDLAGSATTEEPVRDDAQFAPSEAEAIWSIASRLQAEATRRLEERSRAIAETTSANSPTFSLNEVKQIGDEAGIGTQFIDLAIRHHAATQLGTGTPSRGQTEFAERVLGSKEERITVTRVVNADQEAVLGAIQDTFTSERYNLQLIEAIGDPKNLADSTLIFKVPTKELVTTSGGINSFAYAMSFATLNRMTVSLHAIGDGRTEVSMQVDLTSGKWRNAKVSLWVSGIFAFFAALLAVLIAAKKTALGFFGVAGVTAAVSAVVGLGFGWLNGWSYRYGLRKGRKAMQELLALVDIEARTGGFGRKQR